MHTFVYARVSTPDQTTDNQFMEIEEAGYVADMSYGETISGKIAASERPEFQKMLDAIKRTKRPKQLVVAKLDRLGRDTVDVLSTVQKLEALGCTVIVLQLGKFDLTSPAGQLVLATLSAVGQMERDMLVERTIAGLARAKRDGKTLGRPKVTNGAKTAVIHQQLAAGVSVAQVAREVGISRQTVMRVRDAAGQQ